MIINSNLRHYNHYYNHVSFTPWPFYLSISVFLTLFYAVLYLNRIEFATYAMIISGALMIMFSFMWILEIFIESYYLGRYTRKVRASLILGFLLFLLSEICVFSGFFWAFFDRLFHSFLYFSGLFLDHSTISILWIVKPAYGTALLVFSGYLCNLTLLYLQKGVWEKTVIYSTLSVFLGYLFLYVQFTEYNSLLFNINSNVLTSCFYLLTGFHGFHVIVGLIFLNIQTSIIFKWMYSRDRNMGYSMAVLYWHFVDIIWIFLFIVVYAHTFFTNTYQFYL